MRCIDANTPAPRAIATLIAIWAGKLPFTYKISKRVNPLTNSEQMRGHNPPVRQIMGSDYMCKQFQLPFERKPFEWNALRGTIYPVGV